MSQFSPDHKKQQPQGQYLPEQPSYDQLPCNQQAYPPHSEQRAQGQYHNDFGYDQGCGKAMEAPQQQYHPNGANASYYNEQNPSDPNDPNGPEGEKGLGSTVVGGAAGGYMGHKMGGGWGTAAGAALGAVGMNVVSHKMKKHQAAPVQQAPVQQVPVQQVVAVPGVLGHITQRRLARKGLLGL